MKKWQIVILVIVVLALVGGLFFWILNKEEEKEIIDLTNPVATIESDSFAGKVIANDYTNISIVPNDGELIKQTFKIVEATVLDTTKITVNGQEKTAEDIAVGAAITVTFNGDVYQTGPARVIGISIDAVQSEEPITNTEVTQ